MNLKRGDVIYVKASNYQPTGSEMWADRPAIIISNDINNKKSPVLQIVYTSTKINKENMKTHIRLHSLLKPSIAICEQIHSVDKSRITKTLTSINEDEMKQIEKAIKDNLNLKPN